MSLQSLSLQAQKGENAADCFESPAVNCAILRQRTRKERLRHERNFDPSVRLPPDVFARR